MKRLGKSSVLAAAAIALAASGCLVEHRVLVRDDPPPAAPPRVSAPDTSSDDIARDEAPRAEPGPGVEVDEQTFYDRLSPYGHWQETPEYGRVWIPGDVSADFRPYYDGHWSYTDYGWTYVGAAPWSWACYHYGYWGFGLGLGWYWIPGRVWGPAWVSWRYGGGYVAWAPIGPRGYYYGVTSPAWIAVGESHFTQPIRTVAVPVQRTAGIVASAAPQAMPRASAIASGRAARSYGPPVAKVSRAVGHDIRPVAVNRVLPNAGMGRSISRAAPNQRGYSGSRNSAPRAGQRGDRWNRSVRQPPGRWGTPGGRSPGRYGTPPRAGSGGPRYGTGGSRSQTGGARSSGGSSGRSAPAPSSGGHSSGGHSGGHHK